MKRKVWKAEELERLSPSEQDALFEAGILRDLDEVPADFLDGVRRRIQARSVTAGDQ